MPLFQMEGPVLNLVEQENFDQEKTLQRLIENNLGTVFSCRHVATEFSTGAQHAGRIDTLALSEDNNPVIIEYKKIESSELINQSLFYLSWINDHRGDFELAAQRSLGHKMEVDWGDVRVICIAPKYKKYDLHAVQVMGANIELWKYRLFKNSCLYLEEVFRRGYQAAMLEAQAQGKNPLMVAAGKKAALTRATGSYSFEEHLKGKSELVKRIALSLQEYILELDPAIEEAPKKYYIAYKASQNIACMAMRKNDVGLFLKLNPKRLGDLPAIARDVSEVGHHGTGDLEITVRSENELPVAYKFINLAYERVGGS